MGIKNIKVNSKSSKCEEEELRRTVLKKKKNRPLSACFMKPVSFNQNSNSDNKFIKQSKYQQLNISNLMKYQNFGSNSGTNN